MKARRCRPRRCRLGQETEGRSCEEGSPAPAVLILKIGRKRRALCGVCAVIEVGAAIGFGDEFSVERIKEGEDHAAV